MIKKICIATLVILALFYSSVAYAKNVTLDEETFNKLVSRAKEADVFEEEKNFYKKKYEESVSRALELNSLYREDISLKDRIIASQKELTELNLERIKTKDEIINMQDKKISKLERNNFFKNFLILGVTAGGIAVASNNNESGAAVGIGAAGLATLLIH